MAGLRTPDAVGDGNVCENCVCVRIGYRKIVKGGGKRSRLVKRQECSGQLQLHLKKKGDRQGKHLQMGETRCQVQNSGTIEAAPSWS